MRKGHLRQGEQVGGADEEVAVEGGDAQALGAADAHDGLPSRRPRQVVPHVMRQLGAVALGAEGRQRIELAAGVLGQRRQRGQVHVHRRHPLPARRPGVAQSHWLAF